MIIDVCRHVCNPKATTWKKTLNLTTKFGRIRKMIPSHFRAVLTHFALDGDDFQKEEKSFRTGRVNSVGDENKHYY